MNEIIEALVALARAAGSSYTTVSIHDDGVASVHLDGGTDSGARALASALDVELELTGNDKTEWLTGRTKVGDIFVTVYGPHHERPQPRDESVIATALAQADEAIRP